MKVRKRGRFRCIVEANYVTIQRCFLVANSLGRREINWTQEWVDRHAIFYFDTEDKQHTFSGLCRVREISVLSTS